MRCTLSDGVTEKRLVFLLTLLPPFPALYSEFEVAATENKDADRKRAHTQDMPAHSDQPTYPFAKVNRLDSRKDPHMRREPDYDVNLLSPR